MLKRLLIQTHRLNNLLLASIFCGAISTLLQIFIIAAAFYLIIQHQFSWTYALILLFVALALGFSRFGEQYLGHFIAFHLLADLRMQLYDHLLSLAPAKLDDKESGKILKLLVKDIEQIEVFYAHTIAPVAIAVLLSFLQSFLIFLFSPLMGTLALLSYFWIGFVLPLFRKKKIENTSSSLSKYETENDQLLSETVNGKSLLQQFQKIEQRISLLDKQRDLIGNTIKKGTKKGTFSDSAAATATQLSLLFFSIAMGYLAFNFSVGNTLCWVIAFTFPFSFGRVLALANLPSSLGNALLSAKNIFKILDEKAVSNLSENQEISLIKQSRFVDVNFSYPLRPNKTVLKDASLIGKKSEVIGIIGESGERKSALMKLLMKWYQPKKGLIEVYNHDLRKIKKSGLRKQINYVAQNPLILSGTIRENITLKNNSFSDSKIWESLKKVELDKTVKKMPKELDTKISRLEQRFFFRRIAKTGNCQSIAVPEFNIDFKRTDKQLGHP
ncbi:ABC transporter transmembrane domain-containing protein [Oenococcus oeni]|uniref:ABC transporter transmembrane domain-containing protein n=1 Tax=Oenococcus oeni TaxID=1247 RepID=UPI000A618221|nr:ABC transporter ATP-binding protein [Oenococcus oeni]